MRWSRSSRATMRAMLVAALVATGACHPDADPPSKGRLIVIGIDGASPRVVEPLMAEGRLPNLARIAETGIYAHLRSEVPSFSPRIWNTIATGKTPEEHGILGFVRPGPDGRQQLYVSTDRRASPLWSIADDAGLTVGVVNMWNTYPLEKVDGVMVSDHILAKEVAQLSRLMGVEEPDVGSVIYPEAWEMRLSSMVAGKATPLPGFDSPFANDKPLPRWVRRGRMQRRFDEDGALARMAQEISKAERPDVMMVLMTGIDRVSHHIWGVLEPPDIYRPELVPTAAGRAGGVAALYGYYEYTDALIGEILEGFGPEDRVMVVSDHGFEGVEKRNLTGGHLSEAAVDGVLFASGPGIMAGADPGKISVYDVAPTLLAWLGLPVALDMTGTVAPFLDVGEVRTVDTYDGLAVEFVDADEVPSGVEDEIVDQLEALGYIDEQ